MRNATEWVQRQSPWKFIFLGLLWMAGLMYVDQRATPAASFSLFYMLAVALVAWGAGRWAGLVAAVIGGVLLFLDESHVPRPSRNAWILWWNGFARLGVFALVALLAAAIRKVTRSLEQRVHDRTAALQNANIALQRSTEELKDQTRILRSVCSSIGEGIVVADRAGRLTLFNPAAEAVIGLGAMELPASEWSAAYGVFNADSTTPSPAGDLPLARAMRGESTDGVELFIRNARRPQGVFISVTGRPLMNESGEHTGGVIAIRDISERKALERQILEISDREQARMAHDLHDGLCQQLVGTAFLSTELERRLAALQLQEAETAARISADLDAAITEARGLARGLYPVHLESNGLAAALQELVDHQNTGADRRCEFLADDAAVTDNAVATQLFRIAQEAVTNAARHAAASRIVIRLDRNADGLKLTVSDNGRGIQKPPSPHLGMGLEIMAHRARAIQGVLTIEPCADGGTVVSCLVAAKSTAP